MSKSLVFTVLPNGATTNATGEPTARLSVFVSFRLDPEDGPTGELGDFDLGAGFNWPVWVSTASFRFRFGTGAGATVLMGTRIESAESALDPALWALLFPPATPVRAFDYESLSSARLISYPVRDVHDAILGAYQGFANDHPKDVPTGTQSGVALGLLQAAGRVRSAVRELEKDPDGPSSQQIVQALGVDGADDDVVTAARAYYRLYRFYNRHLASPLPEEPPDPPDEPELDFHQMVTALGDYPILLRKLGIVIDFEVTGSLLVTAPTDDLVRVDAASPPAGGVDPDHRYPSTRYELDTTEEVFEARTAAGSDLADRQLDLSDEDKFMVSQLDVDGGGLKVIDYAGNMTRLQQDFPVAAMPVESKPPSLRTAGVAVSRVDRSDVLEVSFATQDTIDDAIVDGDQGVLDGTPLLADDLLRGYRVDVLGEDGDWRSLHARVGTYVAGSGDAEVTLGPLPDEGYIKTASASSEEDAPDDLYLHEHVFSWEGWSLAAPRPSRTLSFEKDDDDPRIQTPTVEHVRNRAVTDLELEAEFVPRPGSLPPLRFGRRYRLRARAVDLAGNSLPLSTPTDESRATPRFTYRRYEPAQQPILVYRRRIGEGESLEHLVIRSDRGATADEYVEREEVFDSGYSSTCQRHVAPPKQTQAMCELHGAFDELMQDEDQDTHVDSYLVALKEAGTFQDREVFDPSAGEYVELGDTIELISTASTPEDRVGEWPDKRGDSLAAGQYVVHTETEVMLPYLPDPIAAGIALEDRDTDEVYQREYEGDWPDVQPFRLVLREGTEVDAEPRVEVDGDTLDVFLPQATIYKLHYSTLLRGAGLDVMAHYQELEGEALERARLGVHWMLSPQREITFVHAVQRPLEDPVAAVEVDDGRAPGQTWARVSGQTEVHGRSTAQLDLLAHWIDPVDLVTRPGPEDVYHRAQVVTQTVRYQDTELPFPNGARHELSDTKHHRVVYQAVGTTRYREYFPPAIWANADNVTAREPVFEEGTEGDDPPSFDKAIVHVLSTARPDVPKLLYMVPTFRWLVSEDGLRKTREGRGIRVYLDRPWYSSGVGELLGVTFVGNGVPAAVAERFGSQWGSDPLRKNITPQNRLSSGHFLNAEAVGNGLTAAEGDTPIGVVGFEVEYNAERKLWFADIDFTTGNAYFPFVRLVLCRYQPDSISGLEISRTVLSEFVQLAPDRVASITRDGSVLRLALSGVTSDNTGGSDDVDEVEPADLGDIAADEPGGLQGPAQFMAQAQLAPNKALHHVVLAQFEVHHGDSDLDWRPLGNPVELLPYDGDSAAEVLWRGQLNIPAAVSMDRAAHRVAISEYEVYETDPDVAESVDPKTVHPVGDHPGSRLVYLAHFEVPANDGPLGISGG